MDLNNIPAYVIALNEPGGKQMNNWRSIFPSVKWFRAINGKKHVNLNDSALVHDLARMHAKCERERSETIFAVTGMGCIGCFLSHYLLWKKASELPEHIPGLVVIEEDVEFSKFAQLKIRAVFSSKNDLPQDADLLSLLYIALTHKEEYSNEFVRLTGPRMDGAQTYFVSRRGGKILCKNALPIYTQADAYMGITMYNNSTFRGYALKTRLYSMYSVIKDNISSSVQANFKIKKYLPKGNRFYYTLISLVILFGALSITLICVRKKVTLIVQK